MTRSKKKLLLPTHTPQRLALTTQQSSYWQSDHQNIIMGNGKSKKGGLNFGSDRGSIEYTSPRKGNNNNTSTTTNGQTLRRSHSNLSAMSAQQSTTSDNEQQQQSSPVSTGSGLCTSPTINSEMAVFGVEIGMAVKRSCKLLSLPLPPPVGIEEQTDGFLVGFLSSSFSYRNHSD